MNRILGAPLVRYLVFCLLAALVCNLEIQVLGRIIPVRPALLNIDYFLMGAGAWQPVLFLLVFVVDFLWAVAMGGFFGFADLPVLLENSMGAGWLGVASLVLIACALVANILLARVACRLMVPVRPRWRWVLLAYVVLGVAGVLVRDSFSSSRYLVNSAAFAIVKNVVFRENVRQQLLGAAASMTPISEPSFTRRETGKSGKRTLVVVLESWGLDFGGQSRKSVQRIFAGLPYVVGSTPFHGTTVHGEFRELCGVQLGSLNVIDVPRNCLPQEQAATGAEVLAFHGNDAHFYRRNRWYPKVGFGKFYDKPAVTGDAAFHGHEEADDNPFDAIPDDQMLDFIGQVGKRSSTAHQFYYFLSISSHGPWLAKRAPAVCRSYGVTGQQCDYFFKIDKTLKDIRDFAAAHPEFEVLAVGDHWPYMLTDKKQLARFDPHWVPTLVIPARASAH